MMRSLKVHINKYVGDERSARGHASFILYLRDVAHCAPIRTANDRPANITQAI